MIVIVQHSSKLQLGVLENGTTGMIWKDMEKIGGFAKDLPGHIGKWAPEMMCLGCLGCEVLGSAEDESNVLPN